MGPYLKAYANSPAAKYLLKNGGIAPAPNSPQIQFFLRKRSRVPEGRKNHSTGLISLF